MTCKLYNDRSIVYHCKAQRDGDRYVCECGLDEPFTSDYIAWEDLPKEQRDKIISKWVETPELEDFAPRVTLEDIGQPIIVQYSSGTENPSGAQKFYLVFNPQQSAPTRQHKTLEEAKVEAIRIAAKYPQQKVYVLETVACYTASVDVQEVGVV